MAECTCPVCGTPLNGLPEWVKEEIYKKRREYPILPDSDYQAGVLLTLNWLLHLKYPEDLP